MIRTAQDFSLKELNTFNIGARAKKAVWFTEIEDLPKLHDFIQGQKWMILGGGSNVLLTTNYYNGNIIIPELKDIVELDKQGEEVLLRVYAGVEWDSFVHHCVEKGWGGVENLSAIPGRVGAAPIQNIGAYGVEVKDVIQEVEFYHIPSKKIIRLNARECEFGYRDSIFKNQYSGEFIILSVDFKLTLKDHKYVLHYGDLKETVLKRRSEVNLYSIRDTVIEIRESKLPDYKLTGNAGSFFKNPVVDTEFFSLLLKKYENIPHYSLNDRHLKIPAAWLIEKSGWKGKEAGNAAVHDKQPLVLINKTGNATGEEILNLADCITSDVQKLFGIQLQMEVNKV